MNEFWNNIYLLATNGKIVIDRPKGSAHPRYPSVIYPLDYGYISGTKSSDGNEIDIWRGSLDPGIIVGIVLTVDMIKNDCEPKVLVGCTNSEIEVVLNFHNGDFQSAIYIPNPHQ